MADMSNRIPDPGAVTLEEVDAAMEVISLWNDGNGRIHEDASYLKAIDPGIDLLESDPDFQSVFRVA